MGGCCEHFEAILYGAYYIILLPKPHDNTHLHICKTSYRLVFLSVCLSCLSSCRSGPCRHTRSYCCSKRTRIRSHVLHALAVQAVCHIVGPTKTRQGPSRFALGLTTTVGMIEQGRLDSVLWFCNTCNSPAQPIRPWSFPWCSRYASPLKTGCTVGSTSLDVAHTPSQSSLCSRADVAGRERVDLPRNGYRTRNAAVLPGACCIDQGHAGATASEWAPLPSNVPFGAGPSASDHLQVRTKRVTHSPLLLSKGTNCRQQAHALFASCPDDRSRTTRPVRSHPPSITSHHSDTHT